MVVNSLAFLWFFLVVLVIYYLCQKQKEVQNIFLLGSSYWFYSQVDIWMTGLLVFLTMVFWFLGKGVHIYLEKEDVSISLQNLYLPLQILLAFI